VCSKALYDNNEVTLLAFLYTWLSYFRAGSRLFLGMFSNMVFTLPWRIRPQVTIVFETAVKFFVRFYF